MFLHTPYHYCISPALFPDEKPAIIFGLLWPFLILSDAGTLWPSLPLCCHASSEKTQEGHRKDDHRRSDEDVREGEIRKKSPEKTKEEKVIGQGWSDNMGKSVVGQRGEGQSREGQSY